MLRIPANATRPYRSPDDLADASAALAMVIIASTSPATPKEVRRYG
ncbi:MAG: hypothetical protein WAV20_04385 [Blastocatellia bacterium]